MKHPIWKEETHIKYKSYRKLDSILMKKSKQGYYNKYFWTNWNNIKNKWCTYNLPHYTNILLIYCILLLAEILLMLKTTLKNAKNALHFFKENFRLRQAKSFTTLDIFIAKWISKNNLNAETNSDFEIKFEKVF